MLPSLPVVVFSIVPLSSRWSALPSASSSRLGDGVFWYGLMLMLPLAYGETGARVTLQMALTALVGLGALSLSSRPVSCASVRTWRTPPCSAAAPALDRYSFPSGHTLHAVAFTLLAIEPLPGARLAARSLRRAGRAITRDPRSALSERRAWRAAPSVVRSPR